MTTGTIHQFRASYGTELLRGGTNIRVVQDLMRHGSLASTEHYLGVNESERRDAIAGLDLTRTYDLAVAGRTAAAGGAQFESAVATAAEARALAARLLDRARELETGCVP